MTIIKQGKIHNLLFVYYCRRLISFANSLDLDQARHFVRPDLDPNCLTLIAFLKEFFEKVDFEKNQQTTKKHAKLPSRQSVNEVHV